MNNSTLVAGTVWGKVRSMFDHQNNILREANPSDAIQITGWKDLPQSGQEFLQVSSEVIIFKSILFVYKLTINIVNVFNICKIETCTRNS